MKISKPRSAHSKTLHRRSTPPEQAAAPEEEPQATSHPAHRQRQSLNCRRRHQRALKRQPRCRLSYRPPWPHSRLLPTRLRRAAQGPPWPLSRLLPTLLRRACAPRSRRGQNHPPSVARLPPKPLRLPPKPLRLPPNPPHLPPGAPMSTPPDVPPSAPTHRGKIAPDIVEQLVNRRTQQDGWGLLAACGFLAPRYYNIC